MWGRYIPLGADTTPYSPEHLRRVNYKPAPNQLRPSKYRPKARRMASGTPLQSSVSFPDPKPNIIHRISDSFDTNHSFVTEKPERYISGVSSNSQQYHQLERGVAIKGEPSAPSVADVTPINSHNPMAMSERDPGSATTTPQRPLYDSGDLNHTVAMLESDAGQLRNERDAALTRADRLAEDFARADQEVHHLRMKLSDLGAENGTLKWTVNSLDKELQLAQARVIDTQRQAPTNYPPHNSYIHHGDHAAELEEMHARYAREHRYLEQLEEERKILLDDNHDLQRVIEMLKDAEVDLKRQLKSYRSDNEALCDRLATAKKSAGSGTILNRELESKRDQIAQLTRGKKEAERALEQMKRAANMGPELISAFSELEAMLGQGGHLASRKRLPKGSRPTGSSGQLNQGSREFSDPIPKRQRHE